MRPILVLNPRHDAAFVELAQSLVERGASSPETLQAELRGTYPNAVVRARSLSAEPVWMWYVYREGHWINGRDHPEE
jgi:hypothetical protein